MHSSLFCLWPGARDLPLVSRALFDRRFHRLRQGLGARSVGRSSGRTRRGHRHPRNIGLARKEIKEFPRAAGALFGVVSSVEPLAVVLPSLFAAAVVIFVCRLQREDSFHHDEVSQGRLGSVFDSVVAVE